jgi:cell wall-associated NlpC family hydrolase
MSPVAASTVANSTTGAGSSAASPVTQDSAFAALLESAQLQSDALSTIGETTSDDDAPSTSGWSSADTSSWTGAPATGSSADGVTTLGEMVTSAGGTSAFGLASAYLPSLSTSLSGLSGSSSVSSLSGLGGLAGIGTGATAASAQLARFIDSAATQVGKPYVFGAEANLDDPDPAAFDCSELTQWAAHQAGLTLPDGAAGQYRYCRSAGTTMSVEDALRTPGALLFSFDGEPGPTGGEPAKAHVAISLGDGRTLEAKGRAYGVVVADAADRFNFAAAIPR